MKIREMRVTKSRQYHWCPLLASIIHVNCVFRLRVIRVLYYTLFLREMTCNVGKDRLIRGLCRQRESGEYCDVLITIPDIMQITAHSNVLAISSLYFSDISRKPSSVLPHIPSVRVGGYVSLSVTIDPCIQENRQSDKVRKVGKSVLIGLTGCWLYIFALRGIHCRLTTSTGSTRRPRGHSNQTSTNIMWRHTSLFSSVALM